MNLQDFKNKLDKNLYDKGLEYYIENRISDIKEYSANMWQLKTTSPDTKTIYVQLNKKYEIVKSFCNCSNSDHFFCKHEIASYIALSEKILANTDFEIEHDLKISEEMKNEIQIEKLINSLNPSEVKHLLIKFALENSTIQNHLLTKYNDHYNNTDNKKDKYKNIIGESIKKNTASDGFINYWSSKAAVSGAEDLLSLIPNFFQKKDYYELISIAQAVIEEVVPAIQYSDDSDGLLGETINYAFDIITECSYMEIPEPLRTNLFKYCLNESQKELYKGWSEWIVNFLFASARLIRNDEEEKQVLDIIDKRIIDNSNGFISSYYEEYCILIKYEICSARKQKNFTEDFIKRNIHYPAIKEIAVKAEISNENYDKAEQIAKEGIAQFKEEKRYPLVKKWDFLLLDIYENSENTDKLKDQLKYLFKTYHDFESYFKLKEISSKKEWDSFLIPEIKHIKTNSSLKPILPSLLGEIYVRENMKQELLQLLQNYPSYISEYDKFLLPEFSDQIVKLYFRTILFESEFALEQPAINKIVNMIKHVS